MTQERVFLEKFEDFVSMYQKIMKMNIIFIYDFIFKNLFQEILIGF